MKIIKNNKIVYWSILILYFLFTAISLFALIILDRVLLSDIASYLLIVNLLSLVCISFLLNKKIIALLLFITVTVVAPIYYFNPYVKIKNTQSTDFQTLKGQDNLFKFYLDDSENFLLIKQSINGFSCYGPYKTNEMECVRLGKKLFD